MTGIKIIGVKVVGLCSKCRKVGDEIPKYNSGGIIPDKDISCINEAFGDALHENDGVDEK